MTKKQNHYSERELVMYWKGEKIQMLLNIPSETMQIRSKWHISHGWKNPVNPEFYV